MHFLLHDVHARLPMLTVWAKWVKIHRIFRDLKKMKQSADSIFMKMMLHSGLRLTHEIMQDCLYNHSRMIYVAELPCWEWYLEQVEKVKSPADAFTYALKLSGTKWL